MNNSDAAHRSLRVTGVLDFPWGGHGGSRHGAGGLVSLCSREAELAFVFNGQDTLWEAPVGWPLKAFLFLSQRYLFSAWEETRGKLLRITSLVRQNGAQPVLLAEGPKGK